MRDAEQESVIIKQVNHTTLTCTCTYNGELHANDDCMLINDEQDEVHALIAYVFRPRKHVGFVLRVGDLTTKFFRFRLS